jgi:uncharacterized membrane protein (DUF485 family)
MSSVMYERIRRNPKFEAGSEARELRLDLVGHRADYFLRLLHAGRLQPGLLGQKIAEGSMWAIGYTIELVLFVFFWLLTFLYVRRANGEFDDLTAEMIKEAQKEKL